MVSTLATPPLCPTLFDTLSTLAVSFKKVSNKAFVSTLATPPLCPTLSTLALSFKKVSNKAFVSTLATSPPLCFLGFLDLGDFDFLDLGDFDFLDLGDFDFLDLGDLDFDSVILITALSKSMPIHSGALHIKTGNFGFSSLSFSNECLFFINSSLSCAVILVSFGRGSRLLAVILLSFGGGGNPGTCSFGGGNSLYNLSSCKPESTMACLVVFDKVLNFLKSFLVNIGFSPSLFDTNKGSNIPGFDR